MKTYFDNRLLSYSKKAINNKNNSFIAYFNNFKLKKQKSKWHLKPFKSFVKLKSGQRD
jgi:hypothetical protein